LQLPVRGYQTLKFLKALRYCCLSRCYTWPRAQGRQNYLADAAADPMVLHKLEVVLLFHYFSTNKHQCAPIGVDSVPE
jgi:hypothetical protein